MDNFKKLVYKTMDDVMELEGCLDTYDYLYNINFFNEIVNNLYNIKENIPFDFSYYFNKFKKIEDRYNNVCDIIKNKDDIEDETEKIKIGMFMNIYIQDILDILYSIKNKMDDEKYNI